MSVLDITEVEVLERLQNLKSSKQLALKGAINWDKAPEEAKSLLLRDILAMSNSGGGWIVYGAKDGEWVGLTDEEFQSFSRLEINAALKMFAQPEVECHMGKIAVTQGKDSKRLAIIEVPEFNSDPVICSNDAESADRKVAILENGALYVRSDDARSERVGSFVRMRELIDRALSRRKQNEAVREASEKQLAAELNGAAEYFRAKSGGGFEMRGYWELAAYPVSYVKERTALAGINTLLEEARSEKTRTWFFQPQEYEMFNSGGQYISATQKTLECARFYKSGVCAWRSVLTEDYTAPQVEGLTVDKVLSLESALELISRFFIFVSCYYGKMGLDCDVHAELLLRGAMGRKLVSTSPFYTVEQKAVARVDTVSIVKIIKPEELFLQKKHGAAAALDFLSLFNWHDLKTAQKYVLRVMDVVSQKAKTCKS